MGDSMTDEICLPGTRIGGTAELLAGNGTYVFDDIIYASVLGLKKVTSSKDGKFTVEIEHNKPPSVVPKIEDVVTARITRINTRFAAADILCVGSKILPNTFPGQVRARDVREFEVDSVEIYKSFKPGDIIKAKIISLGDSRSYYLSTASNEHGVMIAHSPSGSVMVPISWQEMQCPVTNVKEFRKVAKIDIANETLA